MLCRVECDSIHPEWRVKVAGNNFYALFFYVISVSFSLLSRKQ